MRMVCIASNDDPECDYIREIRTSLTSALSLCIKNPHDLHDDRHPDVEVHGRQALLPEPTNISKSENESCYIEASSNSIRISFQLHEDTSCRCSLQKMFARFLMQKADSLDLLRRMPVLGYDVSFLVTAQHMREHGNLKLVDFLCGFIAEVSSEVDELEAAILSQGRAVATDFLRALAF